MISRWTVLNGVLVAIVALLAVEIGRTWMRAVPPLRMPAAGDGTPRRDTKARPVRAEKTEEDVALITSMDLFDQSRQAPSTASDTAAPVEVPPPTGIEVVGIRVIAGDQEAFIRDASQGNAQRRVRTGDEVAGFTVQSINATAVELGNANGQNVTLYLQLAPSPAGAKPGVAAAGARRPATPAAAGAAAQQGVGAAGTPPANPAALRQQQRLQQRQQRLQQMRQQKRNAAGMPAAKQQRLDLMREKGA